MQRMTRPERARVRREVALIDLWLWLVEERPKTGPKKTDPGVGEPRGHSIPAMVIGRGS